MLSVYATIFVSRVDIVELEIRAFTKMNVAVVLPNMPDVMMVDLH
jgi:hypothetical protein